MLVIISRNKILSWIFDTISICNKVLSLNVKKLHFHRRLLNIKFYLICITMCFLKTILILKNFIFKVRKMNNCLFHSDFLFMYMKKWFFCIFHYIIFLIKYYSNFINYSIRYYIFLTNHRCLKIRVMNIFKYVSYFIPHAALVVQANLCDVSALMLKMLFVWLI